MNICIYTGDFLTRINNNDKQTTKNEANRIELEKKNYGLLLAKLICPNCLVEQSFDEYYEKIR
jgi:hypothetical protein